MVAIIGAGYAGLTVAEKLLEEGINATVYDLKGKGGELAVFARIEELRELYEKFIERIEESQVDVVRGFVASTNPLRIVSDRGVEVKEEKEVFVCTGAVDLTPAASEVYGKRPAGIYTLETAIRLLADRRRIGNRVLILSRKDERIIGAMESHLTGKDYEVEVLHSEEPVEVYGNKRVERVEIAGESVPCDTLIIYGGRKPFNPRKLEGKLAGNVVECTYDYEKVYRNVQRIMF
ncbi:MULTISPECIES: NAD(P)/FAD-dependent oxidoreductase [unclassified Archaeoglobus]|jgi:NADPH-dependent 2,4-dienoyl-CoA reductase/sulfur reductase-like enzyme|uniref:hypothetical protein n=1 Tax=unclassified Archaeoglobus TaxID=2643606 RepID=UPI0025C2BA88|nr:MULTISPECIES: hypothetical protein [unclassified Archaeoglobus]